MDPQLWIGLADVAPTEGNDDEAFEEAAGAYVHALAVAADADEFAERVRAALEPLELELLELESSEPVTERLRRDGLSDALVELAIEAAGAGEVEFGTFHLYPWEDAETPDVREAVMDALRGGRLVQITATDETLEGFVVGCGEEWLLLHWLDPGIFLNGYTALPLDDVEEIEPLGPDRFFAATSLEARGERPVPQPEIALDSLAELLGSVARAYPLVGVHGHDEGTAIGRVARLDDQSFILHEVSVTGAWDGSGGYRYDDIDRVTFGNRYKEALALVAGEPPA